MAGQVDFGCLNTKERAILALWICGESAKQSSRYLNFSYRTVEHYRDKIRCKFGVMSTEELRRQVLLSDQFELVMQLARQLLLNGQQ